MTKFIIGLMALLFTATIGFDIGYSIGREDLRQELRIK